MLEIANIISPKKKIITSNPLDWYTTHTLFHFNISVKGKSTEAGLIFGKDTQLPTYNIGTIIDERYAFF